MTSHLPHQTSPSLEQVSSSPSLYDFSASLEVPYLQFLLQALMLDTSKCNSLRMEGKRELVHEISKWSEGAPDVLKSWSRRELLQILCEEMGKERKYTGLTKSKLIEHLMKTVSEKKSTKRKDASIPESQPLPTNNSQNTIKRQRKTDKPSHFPIALTSNTQEDVVNSKYCQNLACRATLHLDDAFCKRCSCCICFQYDDNKDPSLWLVCNSDPPFEGDSCGMSCHLECAIKHERTGITKDEHHRGLDGSFKCAYCEKVNDLLSCWRKQLATAKDARRVDILCYRLSLSQKLLWRTKKYPKLNEIVETAAEKLEAEVGPIAGLPVKMARGIVNRLSSGPDIQKLCASAVEALDLMLSANIPNHQPNSKTRDCSSISAHIRFENVNATSLTVVLGSNDISAEEIAGYTLWHRKVDTVNYPPEPTCTLLVPNTRFILSDLSPATEYMVKVTPFDSAKQVGIWEVKFTTSGTVHDVQNTLVAERDQSPTTNSSSLSNPSSEGDESNNITAYRENIDNLPGNVVQDIMPGVSVSVLDEERATWENDYVHNSTIQIKSRTSEHSTMSQQLTDIPKPKCLSPEAQSIKELSTGNDSNSSGKKDMEVVPFEREADANPFCTPTKPGSIVRPEPSDEELYNRRGNTEKVTEIGSSTKKNSKARMEIECTKDGSFEKEYAYCVNVIRQLECDGHLEKNFRLKFVTWYSLRATPEERRIVKVFIDTFTNDPICLAGQLVDTFSDDINKKKKPLGELGMRHFH